MKIFRLFFVTLLFYIYCFSLVFTFFPVSTKILLEGAGLLYVLIKLFSGKFKLKKEFVWIFKYSFFLLLWDTILSIVSGYYQFHFFELIKTPIGSVFAAGLMFEISKTILKTERDFLLFFVFVVFSECALTILMNMMPSLFDLVMKIQITDMGNKEVTDIEGYYRMIGIGSAVYFGVLPVCAFALLACSYLINSRLTKSLSMAFVIIAFLTIAVAYFFSARTSLAIVAIATIPLLLNLKSIGIKNLFVFGVVFLLAVILGINYIENNFNDSMLEWAFGFMVDKESSNSVVSVLSWWQNTDFSLLTFIIGDGCYENPDGTYYQHVDVGWFRIIYYCGIIGLLMIMYFHYKLSLFIYKCKKSREMLLMLVLLFVSYAVILAKGDATLLTFLILFLVYYKGGVFERRNEYKVKQQIKTHNYEIQ